MPEVVEQNKSLDRLVETAIESSPFVRRRKLRFETHDGRVVLRGRVGTYYQKQMAQEAVRGVAGVLAIENQLEVS